METGLIKKLSIIVLARNEEKNIAKVIEEINTKIKKQFEIVVVDDSTDRTPAIVKELSSTHNNVLLAPQIKKGITNAFITGLENISGDAIVVLVGDLSDEIQDINEMWNKIEEGYDIVCASRHMPGGKKVGGNFFQNLFSYFVGKSLNILLNIPTCDVSNSFKMYRKEVFDYITLEESGFSIAMQIILKAFFQGYRIAEIPTTWRNRVSGRSNFSFLRQAKHYLYWYLWGIIKSLTLQEKIRRKI